MKRRFQLLNSGREGPDSDWNAAIPGGISGPAKAPSGSLTGSTSCQAERFHRRITHEARNLPPSPTFRIPQPGPERWKINGIFHCELQMNRLLACLWILIRPRLVNTRRVLLRPVCIPNTAEGSGPAPPGPGDDAEVEPCTASRAPGRTKLLSGTL